LLTTVCGLSSENIVTKSKREIISVVSDLDRSFHVSGLKNECRYYLDTSLKTSVWCKEGVCI